MSDLIEELSTIETRASKLHEQSSNKAVQKSLEVLSDAADSAGRAHSKSWLGYHATVYYDGLEQPPRGAIFDPQWGLNGRFSSATTGEWVEFRYEEILDHLESTKTKPSYQELGKLAIDVATELDDVREELVSVIDACLAHQADDYLVRMKKEATNSGFQTAEQLVKAWAPRGPFMSNDHLALSGQIQIPPHINFLAKVQSIRSLLSCAEALSKTAGRTKSYLSKRLLSANMIKKPSKGHRVFIGHGRSNAWLELKNYIQDRLGLQCDDFNREATAGRTTVNRLEKMLDDACFAFLVLTAEDEQKDGKRQPRMNVIHEAGLFQGKLGFEKAVILLESDCEEFSNIHGLTHIPFEIGKIKGTFHEVSDTLKREGLLE